MPYFDVSGYGRETGKKRKRRYWGRDEDDAINRASSDATVVESIAAVPVPPATERQIAYARDLGLSFPSEINAEEMSDLLDRHLSNDEPAPQWLSDYAREIGVPDVTAYLGKRQLFHMVTDTLAEQGDAPLATWFVWHVCRHLSRYTWDNPRDSGIPAVVVETIAAELAFDPRVMRSIRRYQPEDLSGFGWVPDGDGWVHLGASKATIAYKTAVERLRAAGIAVAAR